MAWVTTTTKNKRKRKKDKEGRNKGNTKKVKGKKKDKMKTKRLACINTSTYKMASDYIYKEEKKKKRGWSIGEGKKKVFSLTPRRNKHIHTEKKFGPELFFFKSSTDLSCV